ncbi:hypothetical protein TNIN_364511 [Trichonephila inaurata madagascariensis]|uniref:Uncharacterized protein n=1 Tax=Trichonephila inaurata madagascariensis TaxID=2747483 RepID=A0A8X7BYQ1_9ARAC|nr:hypothetical protein TNIN_364511 [Trichonephila inaurata madagascariensis]
MSTLEKFGKFNKLIHVQFEQDLWAVKRYSKRSTEHPFVSTRHTTLYGLLSGTPISNCCVSSHPLQPGVEGLLLECPLLADAPFDKWQMTLNIMHRGKWISMKHSVNMPVSAIWCSSMRDPLPLPYVLRRFCVHLELLNCTQILSNISDSFVYE